MKLFLRLKSWQLFTITWGIPILINLVLFQFIDPMMTIVLFLFVFPLVVILYTVGYFGWIWTISVYLNSELPEDVNLNIKFFKYSFSFVVIFFLLMLLLWIISLLGYPPILPSKITLLVIIPLIVISLAIIVWSIGFAAQTLKSIELKRKATFLDFYGEFLLIGFSIIGYWILQPKINRIVKNLK